MRLFRANEPSDGATVPACGPRTLRPMIWNRRQGRRCRHAPIDGFPGGNGRHARPNNSNVHCGCTNLDCVGSKSIDDARDQVRSSCFNQSEVIDREIQLIVDEPAGEAGSNGGWRDSVGEAAAFACRSLQQANDRFRGHRVVNRQFDRVEMRIGAAAPIIEARPAAA